MNNQFLYSAGQSTRGQHVNVAAMAAIMQEFVGGDGSVRQDTVELRERARAAGLNEHEYAAISALCSKLNAEGSAFLEPFRNSGW